ncbi:hypothetical protein [Pseudodesulfovibrio sp. zrk46]|uniref:hypothetical protein n=1 Tax=Pseudodesulfovibrio sp. zrk46 TaxID=2725288 RepID=UPI0014499668|nr:hypothetical protein [Pseudodesulfovibrio sp. zrk46]QJB55562.1 hypothetical protein HFN16_03745 [Pseudodesulfovibrio sp. zrk46]
MKQLIVTMAVALLLLLPGCKKNPRAIIDLPTGPEYVGEYLQTSDVLRIGHALDTIPTRATVQWENMDTGYQYSMMIFSSDSAMGTTTRQFSVLSINSERDGEVLNLIGTSTKKNIWNIVAESSASPVGKAARMQLEATPVPHASLSSGKDFHGFMVEELE